MIIFTFWLCEIVKCNPHRRLKKIQKSAHFALQPIPLKPFSVLLKKITPFGEYGFKHSIKKRQIVQPSEIPNVEGGTLEDIIKIQNIGVADKAEDIPLEPNLTPQVIITSIIKPIEDSVPISIPLPLPEGSDLPIDQKNIEDLKPPDELIHKESELNIIEVASSSENVIEITPRPKIEEIPPEYLEIKNVAINTPVESTVPSISKIPLIKNPNGPFLFTDITRLPLNGFYPAPSIGIPEYIVPSPPLPLPPPVVQPPYKPVLILPPEAIPPPLPPSEIPPIVKEDIPINREDSPNLLVKGSRFVLYFGSMMLQMLSQLVNGHINLNQPIDIPMPITG